mmetsp:Transcript_2974/g.9106  ORF Transcript_2974/g.9106 Transcript_2974/m.9106 type:complete len:204 (+) Transcript_2974:1328-1939(+)
MTLEGFRSADGRSTSRAACSGVFVKGTGVGALGAYQSVTPRTDHGASVAAVERLVDHPAFGLKLLGVHRHLSRVEHHHPGLALLGQRAKVERRRAQRRHAAQRRFRRARLRQLRRRGLVVAFGAQVNGQWQQHAVVAAATARHAVGTLFQEQMLGLLCYRCARLGRWCLRRHLFLNGHCASVRLLLSSWSPCSWPPFRRRVHD